MDQTPKLPDKVRLQGTSRLLVALAIASTLGGVFYLYGNPQLVILLTEQLWACF
jgi:hypothetical protein